MLITLKVKVIQPADGASTTSDHRDGAENPIVPPVVEETRRPTCVRR